MKNVPVIDDGKELQLFTKIRRWAKEMGAPVAILKDLKKIGENRDLVHQIFSGGWDEKFHHITTYVGPLCEAEHINKTVALYKAQLLSGKFGEMSVEEQLKSAEFVQSYLTAKDKHEKIKKPKRKAKAVELNIQGINKAIAIDCCLYDQLKEEENELIKKTVLLDLKAKRTNKQIEEWDTVTDKLKTPVGHIIPIKPILTPEIERKAFRPISSLQDQLKTQGTRVRQLTATNFRTAFKACKELEFIDLRGSSFHNTKDIFLDELEQVLSYPLKIITRSWESDVNVFSPEARMSLMKTTDFAGGSNHKTINNILNLLVEYRKMINFSLPTVDTKILSLIDSCIKEVEMIKDEAVKVTMEKREKVQELTTESNKVQDEIDIVLKDWKELPFYDWIPESLKLDGKAFTEWQEEEEDD